jgi:hypothetical protein
MTLAEAMAFNYKQMHETKQNSLELSLSHTPFTMLLSLSSMASIDYVETNRRLGEENDRLESQLSQAQGNNTLIFCPFCRSSRYDGDSTENGKG